MLERHRESDALDIEPDIAAKTTARIARLTKDARQLREWLATHQEDRRGPTGGLRKSNRTDNESAKMATDKGVIQGYTGVAAVDAKHQFIVDAEAHGTGSEQELLLPVVEALATLRTSATVLTTDAGYHSEANLAALAALEVPALIADPDMRKRDERFADREHHTTAPDPLHDKSGATKKALPLFTPSDFTYDADARTGVCPAGKSLYRTGAANVSNGYVGAHFRGAKRDCAPCALRAPYGQRFATVEPVFGNVRYNKRLDRFTLRGRTKVHGQVAALLPGAPHRKADPRGVCGVTHEAGALRAVANDARIARIAPRYQLSKPNRMTANCFRATRRLYHRCVETFPTALTPASAASGPPDAERDAGGGSARQQQASLGQRRSHGASKRPVAQRKGDSPRPRRAYARRSAVPERACPTRRPRRAASTHPDGPRHHRSFG